MSLNHHEAPPAVPAYEMWIAHKLLSESAVISLERVAPSSYRPSWMQNLHWSKESEQTINIAFEGPSFCGKSSLLSRLLLHLGKYSLYLSNIIS
jgi:hypothetical protein